MKKQYIDFVPTAKQKTQSGMAQPQSQPQSTVSGKKVVDGMVRRTPSVAHLRRDASVVSGTVAQKDASMMRTTTFSIRNGAELGVVQDTNTLFVQTEVAKRPLSGQYFGERQVDVRAVKSEKVGNKAKKTVLTERFPEESKNKETYVPPVSKFINQNKIEKRPLSKTMYRKTVPVVIEEPKGPVTIITKPEKQSHAGLIVTIVLTIILGAAAGTVAFLLLPK